MTFPYLWRWNATVLIRLASNLSPGVIQMSQFFQHRTIFFPSSGYMQQNRWGTFHGHRQNLNYRSHMFLIHDLTAGESTLWCGQIRAYVYKKATNQIRCMHKNISAALIFDQFPVSNLACVLNLSKTNFLLILQ